MTRYLVILLLTVATTGEASDDLAAAFGRDVLVIEASEHACYRFDIYVAQTDMQRARGLMHVRKLPAMTGMLFVYESSNGASMWMKNTYLSLDILFVRRDGRVSSVARNTEPLSLRSISSIEPVTYVLELNAGTSERLAIDANSRLFWGDTHDLDE